MKLRSFGFPVPLLGMLLCFLNESQNVAFAQTATLTDPYACAQYLTCLACLASRTCGWAEGVRCVSGCPGGKGCVTPFYGGNTNQAAICNLPEAQSTFPGNAVCSQYRNCYDCMRTKQCAWVNGNTCTTTCSGQNCLQSNYGGLAVSAASAAQICTLPPAFPSTLAVVPQRTCSYYTSCTTCIGSQHCAWMNGNVCVENCQGGRPCVTPNYGQLADTNADYSTGKTAICALPEGRGLPSTLLRQGGIIGPPDKAPLPPVKSPALRKKESVNSRKGNADDADSSEDP